MLRLYLSTRRLYHSGSARVLNKMYNRAKKWAAVQELTDTIEPRGVFVNNELSLSAIDVYGFDYDYTLAVYTRELNQLIYDLALHRLIEEFKYPFALAHSPYDMEFAIRGLHFDIQHSSFLKVDAFSQVQAGTVFRGKRKVSDEEVKKMYHGYRLPHDKGRDMPQLMDLFSLPWAGLLTAVINYFDTNNIRFDPKCLYDDIAECVKQVHVSGQMYSFIGNDLNHYVHLNSGLKEYLEFLRSHGKRTFVVTNSPYHFINVGMKYMLGDDWRNLFDYIVVSARKPTFFHRNEPFRLFDEVANVQHFEKVTQLHPGNIYSGGNIEELSTRGRFEEGGVLYFGDHIYTDLADPMLRLGWHTAAIVPELAREIRTQNNPLYRREIIWMECLTALIEKYENMTGSHPEALAIIDQWKTERLRVRQNVKSLFNPQFGSIFRTYTNMTYFSRRLNRLSDIYTSRVPNLLKHSIDHTFYPRRNALPHEIQLNPSTFVPSNVSRSKSERTEKLF